MKLATDKGAGSSFDNENLEQKIDYAEKRIIWGLGERPEVEEDLVSVKSDLKSESDSREQEKEISDINNMRYNEVNENNRSLTNQINDIIDIELKDGYLEINSSEESGMSSEEAADRFITTLERDLEDRVDKTDSLVNHWKNGSDVREIKLHILDEALEYLPQDYLIPEVIPGSDRLEGFEKSYRHVRIGNEIHFLDEDEGEYFWEGYSKEGLIDEDIFEISEQYALYLEEK